MDNYPDDIRNYDDHPSSPFYVPPPCEKCGGDPEDCNNCEDEEDDD